MGSIWDKTKCHCAGSIPTEGAWSRLMPQTGDSKKDEKVSSQYMNIPLQRAGEMEELGNLATF